MATNVLISLEEYQATSYRPDCEYIDGQVCEKDPGLEEHNMGKFDHSRIQVLLAIWFGKHESLWNVVALTEQRTHVSPTRVRLPDFCLVPPGPQPDETVTPPLLVVEILSLADSYPQMEARCRDYHQMGVETVWIIDPQTRTARIGHGEIWTETRRLEVPGTPIYVDLDQLFADLDRSRRA
jgi:Uma2 family endonuclease